MRPFNPETAKEIGKDVYITREHRARMISRSHQMMSPAALQDNVPPFYAQAAKSRMRSTRSHMHA
jgi:hypothetical protein